MREGRSERQGSQGPRDPKVLLADLEKMELLDTREILVDQVIEVPKESVVILEFLEREAFRASEAASENPVQLVRADHQVKKVTLALLASWVLSGCWMIPASQKKSDSLSEMKF